MSKRQKLCEAMAEVHHMYHHEFDFVDGVIAKESECAAALELLKFTDTEVDQWLELIDKGHCITYRVLQATGEPGWAIWY